MLEDVEKIKKEFESNQVVRKNSYKVHKQSILGFDEGMIMRMAMMGNTSHDIAIILGIPEDSLEREYGDLIRKGEAMLRVTLRKLQLNSAVKGNVQMQIFLGKQYLGQSDKSEQLVINEGKIPPFVVINENGEEEKYGNS